jgi:hypothetical protein
MAQTHSLASLSEFRFEKHQVAATLVLSTGAMRHGCFFVVTSVTHGGPERVGDLLNGALGFFPFQHDDGSTAQYNRSQLVMVRLPVGVAEEELEPGFSIATRRDVSVTLSTGTVVSGTVLVNATAGHERLSDYVRESKQFWYVLTPGGTLIVNSSHIVALVEKVTQ